MQVCATDRLLLVRLDYVSDGEIAHLVPAFLDNVLTCNP